MKPEGQMSIVDVHLESPSCLTGKRCFLLLLVCAEREKTRVSGEACSHVITYRISFQVSEIYTRD